VDHGAAAKRLAIAVTKSGIQGSVHVLDVTTTVASTKGAKPQVTTMTADLSTNDAAEAIKGSDGSVTELIRTGNLAYIRSTAGVLTNALALTPAVAKANAGKWIVISSTDGPFQTITQALSISSEVSPYLPTKASATFGKARKLKGTSVSVLPISGQYDSTGMSNPITAAVATFINVKSGLIQGGTIVTGSKGSAERKYAIFTNWGKAIHITAPSSAITYATLYKA